MAGCLLSAAALAIVARREGRAWPQPLNATSHWLHSDRAASRAAFERSIAQGWVDAIRTVDPDRRIYSIWSDDQQRSTRDAGLRLDHLLLSPGISSRLVDTGVDRDVRVLENASHHAPTWIRLRDAKPKRGSRSP